MTLVQLDLIAFEAGTQVRAAINEETVSTYAEKMQAGVSFPPIVVFHDGSHYHLADGFHRSLAAKRTGLTEIPAEVHAGTRADALWFALGANETNGLPLTKADKRHAILLALEAFPEKSATQIAEQVGCAQTYVTRLRNEVSTCADLPARVTGKDGKSYPATRAAASAKPTVRDEKREAVLQMRDTGASVNDIATTLHVSNRTVGHILAEAGLTRPAPKPGELLARVQDMASTGYTSQQIADAVGRTPEYIRQLCRDHNITIVAAASVGKSRALNANRIVDAIVFAAEHLTAEEKLIEFSALDRGQLRAWIDSLNASKRTLASFIRRLEKELPSDVEANK